MVFPALLAAQFAGSAINALGERKALKQRQKVMNAANAAVTGEQAKLQSLVASQGQVQGINGELNVLNQAHADRGANWDSANQAAGALVGGPGGPQAGQVGAALGDQQAIQDFQMSPQQALQSLALQHSQATGQQFMQSRAKIRNIQRQLPMDMEQANNQGRGLRMFGSLFSGGAQAAQGVQAMRAQPSG